MIYIKNNEIKESLKTYRKGWYWFAISFVGCMILAAAFIFVKNKKYEVYTSIKINGGSNSANMMATLAKNSGFGDILGMGGTEIDNEITIMQSHHVLYKSVKEIGMNIDYNSRPFVKRKIYWHDAPIELTSDSPIFSDTLGEYLKWKIKVSADGKMADIFCKCRNYGTICDLEDVKLPAHFNTKLGSFTLSTTAYFTSGEKQKINVGWASYTACAQQLMEDMEFGLLNKKADIIQISYKDARPNRTIDLLNAIVRNYELYSIEAKNQSTMLSSDMLQNRIDTVAHQLSVLEHEIEAYKRQHDLAYPELEAKLAVEQMVELKQQLIELEVQSNNITMLQQYVTDPAHKYDPLPLVASMGTNSKDKPALAEYNEAIIQYQNLKRSAIGSNPALIKAEESLETLRKSVNLTLSNMQNIIEKARQETRKEEQKILNLKSGAPVMEREYVELVRQQELKQKILLLLQAQQEQNALTINQDTPRGQLVDEAYVNVLPSGPKPIVIIIVALFFALFLPVAWLRVLNMLCPTLQSPEQLKDLEKWQSNIHILRKDNDLDLKQLAMELDMHAKKKSINVVIVTMQGELAGLAQKLFDILQSIGKNNHQINILKAPAFTQQSDAMYMLSDADVAILAVEQGVTLKENFAYIETLIEKDLMKELVTAYGLPSDKE